MLAHALQGMEICSFHHRTEHHTHYITCTIFLDLTIPHHDLPTVSEVSVQQPGFAYRVRLPLNFFPPIQSPLFPVSVQAGELGISQDADNASAHLLVMGAGSFDLPWHAQMQHGVRYDAFFGFRIIQALKGTWPINIFIPVSTQFHSVAKIIVECPDW